jgi:hypothetical protein
VPKKDGIRSIQYSGHDIFRYDFTERRRAESPDTIKILCKPLCSSIVFFLVAEPILLGEVSKHTGLSLSLLSGSVNDGIDKNADEKKQPERN